jgi:hypothetical protein
MATSEPVKCLDALIICSRYCPRPAAPQIRVWAIQLLLNRALGALSRYASSGGQPTLEGQRQAARSQDVDTFSGSLATSINYLKLPLMRTTTLMRADHADVESGQPRHAASAIASLPAPLCRPAVSV